MTLTTHGHYIPGTPKENDVPHPIKARCGGPGLCGICSLDVGMYNHPSNFKKESGISMINPQQYARKPFYIDAVQVTDDNLKEVAKWCMGDVRTESREGGEATYIKVRVHRPLNERQTKAYIGDWVLYANKGFKVYTRQAFEKNFEPTDAQSKDTLPGMAETKEN